MIPSPSPSPLPAITGRAFARGLTPEPFRRISKVKFTKTTAAGMLAALLLPGLAVAEEPVASAMAPALDLEAPSAPLPSRVVATFGEDIPRAFCAPSRPCHIELEAGERLTDTPTVGDSEDWDVVSKVQGLPPAERPVIAVQPKRRAGTSSLVILTDRRVYWIELVNSRKRHTAILSFTWPDTDARARLAAAERRIEELMLEIGNELWRIRVDAEALGKALNPLHYHLPARRADRPPPGWSVQRGRGAEGQ